MNPDFRLFVLTITFLIALVGHISANHILGGNITFNPIGDNIYEIKLTLLTDCFGSTPASPTTNIFFLSESGECLGFSGSAEISSFVEVSDLLPLEVNQSSCGDGFLPGVYRVEYFMQGDNTVYLDSSCNWRLSWNAADWADFQNVSIPLGSSAFFETTINQSLGTVEGFDIIGEYVPYMRVDEFEDYQIEYSTESDATIDFEMNAILVGDGPVTATPASYVEPYSASEPIEAILLDSNTGVLSVVSPNVLAPYAIGVKITGTVDGVEVFSILNSMAIIVRLCDTGTVVLDGELISSSTEGANIEGGDTLFVEEGQISCFAVIAENLVGGELNIESDFEDYFGEGSYTLSGVNPLTWTGCMEQYFPLGSTVLIEFEISGTGGCGDQVYTTWATLVIVENIGCTDPDACNFDEFALVEDDSCLYEDGCGECGGTGIFGCSDPQACNWQFGATCGDETCFYSSPLNSNNVSTGDILGFLIENGSIGSCAYDLNGDGIVSIADLLILLSWF